MTTSNCALLRLKVEYNPPIVPDPLSDFLHLQDVAAKSSLSLCNPTSPPTFRREWECALFLPSDPRQVSSLYTNQTRPSTSPLRTLPSCPHFPSPEGKESVKYFPTLGAFLNPWVPSD